MSTPVVPFATFDDAFQWLASRTNYETMATQSYDERTYGLDRVHRLLDAVKRPDRQLDVVQIVGSKGKGSTATMLSSILRAAGRRTGLYSSPHLIDARERIRVQGEWADDALVAQALSDVRPHVEAAAAAGEQATFFEIHTVAALLTFAATECDVAVLEAGMGGRLDATSAAEAKCVTLTSLSLDHTAQLGTTVEAVAREKAEAARPGQLLVCGHRPGAPAGPSSALPIVEEICRERASPLLVLGRDFDVEDVLTAYSRDTGAVCTSFTLRHAGHRIHLATPLLGAHQARNAAVAAVTALETEWAHGKVTEGDVRKGLRSTRLQARLEPISTHPLVLVDGAHSPASCAALAHTVKAAIPGHPHVFVVGMARDKDIAGSMIALRGVADHVVGTTSGSPRAAAPEAIAAAADAAGIAASSEPTSAAALAAAREHAGPDGAVIVTGSLYLCGDVLAQRVRDGDLS